MAKQETNKDSGTRSPIDLAASCRKGRDVVSDSGSKLVPIVKLQAGRARKLLAEADIVIAVDAETDEEEVVHGHHEWELATATGQEAYWQVLRVKLDLKSDDLEWLVDAVETVDSGDADDHDDGSEGDEELEDG